MRVFRASPLRAECSCSRDNVEAMLEEFSQDDRDHMVEDGEDFRDLRILQRELSVRAGRGRRKS